WVEMAAAYVRSFDPDAARILLFGYDNAFYYGVLIPALFIATGRGELLPSHLICNEFLLLEGEKFSTSRNHAVWALDALEHVDSHALRWCLAIMSAEMIGSAFCRVECNRFVTEIYEPLAVDLMATLNDIADSSVGEVAPRDPATRRL